MYLVEQATGNDQVAIGTLNILAFSEFAAQLTPEAWQRMKGNLSNISQRAATTEFLVIRDGLRLIGSVGYCPAGKGDATLFSNEMASLVLLSVDPGYRGKGLARQLAEACIEMARKDGATVLALFTSDLMMPAQALYRSLGFERQEELPSRFGIKHYRFVLGLDGRDRAARS